MRNPSGFLIVVLGCLAAPQLVAGPARAEGPASFSHARHLEEGAECDTCHAPLVRSVQLKKEACTDCHDDGAPVFASRGSQEPFLAIFDHAKHTEALSCADCHPGIAKDQPFVRPGQEACASCHATNGVEVDPAGCSACHPGDARRMRPDNHQGAWGRQHGPVADLEVFETHAGDCTLCHQASTCKNCHSTTRPQSHTGFWRLRGHGQEASWDRATCKNCHETGTCVRCHRETAPLNHRGNWGYTHGLVAGGTDNESCAACHNRSWCAACHAQGR